MNALVQIGLSNAMACGVMAIVLLPIACLLQRPAVTHALCVLILLKLFTPPLFSFAVNWVPTDSGAARSSSEHRAVEDEITSRPNSGSIAVPAESANEQSSTTADDRESNESGARSTSILPISPPPPHPPLPWQTEIWNALANHWPACLFAAWAASSLLLGAVTLGRVFRLKSAVQRATVSGPSVDQDVQLLADRLGIRRIPRVRFIAGTAPPMLLSIFGRPEVVIPIQLWDRLARGQQQTLLVHELSHLRRGDHWVRCLEILATCVYWWHPATWLARRAFREAEEQCCDAWVVWAMPDSSRTYMSTLLDAIDFMLEGARPPKMAKHMLASGMGQFHNLQRRLTMVRQRIVQRRLTGPGWTAVVLISAVALPLGARLARGDDQPPAQEPSARLPQGDLGFPIQVDQPRVVADDPTKSSSSADSPKVPDPNVDGGAITPSHEDVARLEAELDAAQKKVDRLRRLLELVKNKTPRNNDGSGPNASAPLSHNDYGGLAASPPATSDLEIGWTVRPRKPSREARLGHIVFLYQDDGSVGAVLAIDHDSGKLLWKLKIPLDSDSSIKCFDNETLLIKSADGLSRLVNAEDGKVTKVFEPGAEVPPATASHAVNPFSASGPRTNAADAPSAGGAGAPPSDQEKRLERVERSIQRLTEAVERLSRDQPAQEKSSAVRP